MTTSAEDPYIWLEEVRSERALDWVRAQNEKTLSRLKSNSCYEKLEARLRPILLADNRLPSPSPLGEFAYDFWQDREHRKGIWRRALISELEKAEPAWETLLDLDALAQAENEDWVWKGADILEPTHDRALISLSRGGKDAQVLREFDIVARRFLPQGFRVPDGSNEAPSEAKSYATWLDRDRLLVATDTGPDSLTVSGYPRQLRLLTRGQPVLDAPVVFEGKREDVLLWAGIYHGAASFGTVVALNLLTTTFDTEIWLGHEQPQRIDLPTHVEFWGALQDHLILHTKKNLTIGCKNFTAGEVFSIPVWLGASGRPEPVLDKAHLILKPPPQGSLTGAVVQGRHLLVEGLECIKSRVWRVEPPETPGEPWPSPVSVELPHFASISGLSARRSSTFALARAETLLQPPSLYRLDAEGGVRKLRSTPSKFESKDLVSEQAFARSADGTRIPYFLVRRRDMAFDGTNPTILYGYGGFEQALTPTYQSVRGPAWLEKGGVYVLANIRGGGEFGPAWHQAALKENRQRAFDDFVAIAVDLIARGVTTSEKLAIHGRSNGGLLVGACMTQRPDLFRAVLCEVPLLDMLRFHKLLAGASWIAEYGDPEIPTERAVLERYSPYQNVHTGRRYPEVFFITSTADDRVHPGHARKMAAKMEAQGHKVVYFERLDGGHAAAADIEAQIELHALEFTFLSEVLGLSGG